MKFVVSSTKSDIVTAVFEGVYEYYSYHDIKTVRISDGIKKENTGSVVYAVMQGDNVKSDVRSYGTSLKEIEIGSRNKAMNLYEKYGANESKSTENNLSDYWFVGVQEGIFTSNNFSDKTGLLFQTVSTFSSIFGFSA